MTDEYALVSGLVPTSQYIFRVSCHNKYGASQYSWASLPVTTGSVGEYIYLVWFLARSISSEYHVITSMAPVSIAGPRCL